MRNRKVVIAGDLYRRLKEVAEKQGYSSVDEFVAHVLERAVGNNVEAATEEEVKERLKGLGYLG